MKLLKSRSIKFGRTNLLYSLYILISNNPFPFQVLLKISCWDVEVFLGKGVLKICRTKEFHGGTERFCLKFANGGTHHHVIDLIIVFIVEQNN